MVQKNDEKSMRGQPVNQQTEMIIHTSPKRKKKFHSGQFIELIALPIYNGGKGGNKKKKRNLVGGRTRTLCGGIIVTPEKSAVAPHSRDTKTKSRS